MEILADWREEKNDVQPNIHAVYYDRNSHTFTGTLKRPDGTWIYISKSVFEFAHDLEGYLTGKLPDGLELKIDAQTLKQNAILDVTGAFSFTN